MIKRCGETDGHEKFAKYFEKRYKNLLLQCQSVKPLKNRNVNYYEPICWEKTHVCYRKLTMSLCAAVNAAPKQQCVDEFDS